MLTATQTEHLSSTALYLFLCLLEAAAHQHPASLCLSMRRSTGQGHSAVVFVVILMSFLHDYSLQSNKMYKCKMKSSGMLFNRNSNSKMWTKFIMVSLKLMMERVICIKSSCVIG